MQTINLKIDDSFFPHFKAIIDSFVKDNKVEIVSYDYENNFPQNVIANSIEEVRERIYEAEKQKNVSQEEYDKLMSKYFEHENY